MPQPGAAAFCDAAGCAAHLGMLLHRVGSHCMFAASADRIVGYSECNTNPLTRLSVGFRCFFRMVAQQPTADFDAKWGQFAIKPALFTKLVYMGV
jgi:hypothetical protein